MLLFSRMWRVVILKCLTKEHVHVWKSVVHGVICTFTNSKLAYYPDLHWYFFPCNNSSSLHYDSGQLGLTQQSLAQLSSTRLQVERERESVNIYAHVIRILTSLDYKLNCAVIPQVVWVTESTEFCLKVNEVPCQSWMGWTKVAI